MAKQLELILLEAIAPPPPPMATECDRPRSGPRSAPKKKAMPESKPPKGKPPDSGISSFVETYCPGGTARGHAEYFRLRYWDSFAPGGGRWRHKHIKGGNIHSPMAQMRAQGIREAIAMGRSPQWVKSLCG